jgi:hypothetical protein
MGDAVVGVAEVVGGDTFAGRNARNRLGFDGHDDDVLVPHVVLLHIGAQRKRRGPFAAIEKDGRARNPPDQRLPAAHMLDKLA